MALTEAVIPKDLIKKYLDRTCGFFVGAGLSRGAGYPDWHGLLQGMIDRAVNEHNLPTDQADDCSGLLEEPGKFLMLAEEMKEVLGAVEFKAYLEETFAGDELAPQPVHDLLVTLKAEI